MVISMKERFGDNFKIAVDFDSADTGTGAVSQIEPRARVKLIYADKERNCGVVFDTQDLNVYLYHTSEEKTAKRISGLGYVVQENLNWMKSSETLRDLLMNNDLGKVFKKLEALSR